MNNVSQHKKKIILILAGGTGGHVYPALAVADALREQGHKVLWLGTHHGIENNVLPRTLYAL